MIMRGRLLNGFMVSALSIPAALAATPAFAQTPSVAVTTNDGILQIIGHADPIVKGVMALLLAASIATWTLWIVKLRELRDAKKCLRKDIDALSRADTLADARVVQYHATREMIDLAAEELGRAGGAPSHRQIEGVEERVAVQLPMVEARAIHHMLSGTNILASIGAIAPFVGLAGTVWGIMNSFLGISRSHSTSLAVVAPGIAEALMATAIGLAAAIPAVLIYNSLSRSIAGYRRLLNEVAVLAACVLSRDSERAEIAPPARPGSRLDTVVPMAPSGESR